MSKVLLISGSNRKGNTEYILTWLNNRIKNSEQILLREKRMEFCKGCLYCHHKNKCIIDDDIHSIIDKLVEAEIIIFGIPNYFDNVSGLFKNFIDRLHPLYKSERLKNKKVYFVYVGGGNSKGTENVMHQSISGLVKYLQLDIKGEFSFQALNVNDICNQEEKLLEMIKEISCKEE